MNPGKFFPEVILGRARRSAGSADPVERENAHRSPSRFEARSSPELERRVELARHALQHGDVSEALLQLRLAQAAVPGHAEVAYLLGLAHLRTGDFLAALEELQAVKRVLPEAGDVDSALRETLTELLPPAASFPPSEPGSLEKVAPEIPAADVQRHSDVSSQPDGGAVSLARPASSISRALRLDGRRAGTANTSAGSGDSARPKLARSSSSIARRFLGLRRSRRSSVVTATEHPTAEKPRWRGMHNAVRRMWTRARASLPHRRPSGVDSTLPVLLLAAVAVAAVVETEGSVWRRGLRAAPRTSRAYVRLAPRVRPQPPPPFATTFEGSATASPRPSRDPAAPVSRNARSVPRFEPGRDGAAVGGPPLRPGGSPPRLARLAPGRDSRALVDPRSGRIEIIRPWSAWTDSAPGDRQAMFWMLVDAEGAVRDVRILRSSGSRVLDREAEDVLEGVGFIPARLEARRIPGSIQQEVIFRGE